MKTLRAELDLEETGVVPPKKSRLVKARSAGESLAEDFGPDDAHLSASSLVLLLAQWAQDARSQKHHRATAERSMGLLCAVTEKMVEPAELRLWVSVEVGMLVLREARVDAEELSRTTQGQDIVARPGVLVSPRS